MPVQLIENGPIVVIEHEAIADEMGNTQLKEVKTAYCRCGKTANQPYCDGSHCPKEETQS